MIPIKLVQAKDLRPGDNVDLEGCKYVKPDPRFESEFVEVLDVTLETLTCVAIGFDFDTVGFPLNEVLKVQSKA
jgi:hypothetical protein